MDEWKSSGSGSGDCIRIRGQTKAIHIRSSLVVVSIYYAINDHALLKSCRYIFRFGQFIYVSNVFFMAKLSLILPVGRSVGFFDRFMIFFQFHGNVSLSLFIPYFYLVGIEHTAESHFGLQMW